jgi:hypothetical protein
MIGGKKFIPIFITSILLTISLSTCINAEEPINNNQKMTIWIPEASQDDYFTQIHVSTEDLQSFKTKLYNILEKINASLSPNSEEGLTITDKEWEQIGDSIDDLIITIKNLDENFPNVDTQKLISNMVEAFFHPLSGILMPSPIFSVGMGFTIIPFYGYESFFGMMLRPIFTRYILGYSRVGGLLRNFYKIGSYSILSIRFTGLFVNFGDIGRDKIIGPTMYLGLVFYLRT